MNELTTERQYIAISNHQTLLNIRALMLQLKVYGLADDAHLTPHLQAIHVALDEMIAAYYRKIRHEPK